MRSISSFFVVVVDLIEVDSAVFSPVIVISVAPARQILEHGMQWAPMPHDQPRNCEYGRYMGSMSRKISGDHPQAPEPGSGPARNPFPDSRPENRTDSDGIAEIGVRPPGIDPLGVTHHPGRNQGS